MRRSARVQLREWALLTLLLGALLVAAVKWDWLERADFWLYDTSVTLSGRAPDPDILILAIDEESMARLGRWPWSRQVLVDVLERLTVAGAGPVLLDIILSEPQRDDPQADARLTKAIAAHGRVVLAVFMPPPGDVAVLPVPALAAGAHLGHAQELVDADGVTRRYLPFESAGAASFPHVAKVLKDLAASSGVPSKASGTSPANVPSPAISRPLVAPGSATRTVQNVEAGAPGPVLISFAGPTGHFPQRSVAALLEGRIPAQELKGRLILLGATAAGLGDNVATPLAGSSGTMPGVELVANVLDGLRAGVALHTVGAGPRLALSAVLLLALMLALLVTTPQAALWVTVLGCTGVALAALAAVKLWGGWWPPAAAITMMAVAYPLWSWRRLEASLSAMTRETRRIAALTQTRPPSGQTGGPAPRPVSFFDPVETRIAAITRAVDQIASALATEGNTPQARQHREDMMRHLAHDLRSPLVSLRALADSLRTDSPMQQAAMLQRIDDCARRALDLSEQFLLMGRAESVDPASFAEVDLVQILHQSADDLWEDARGQGVRIERRCALDCALVHGDARLLHRALLNLGWNGIRHGPPGGSVTLSLQATPTAYVLAVHDQGAGFALEALAHLSQRYTQAPVNQAPVNQVTVKEASVKGAVSGGAMNATAGATTHATALDATDAATGASTGPLAGPSSGAGHGLGLALARLVAAKHHATLTAEHPPGGGFSMALSLPRQ